MEPEPLKGKRDPTQWKGSYFGEEDVASAVEWLKNKLTQDKKFCIKMGFTARVRANINKVIDEAFADVVEEEEKW